MSELPEYPRCQECNALTYAPVKRGPLTYCIECAAHHGDPVNHPSHYTSHPSGVECITVTEHMGFCIGNAIKYLWRADLKGNAIEDLKKAEFYVRREIERREKAADA